MRLFLIVVIFTFSIIPNLIAKTHLICHQKKNIILVGDSLSSGYGLALKKSWVYTLRHKIKERFPFVKLINSSIGGSTTYNGLNRLQNQFKRHNANVVIIALGGNDALRGLNLKVSKQNIEKMIVLSKKNKCQVILISTRIFTNYGPDYTKAFKLVFKDLVSRYQLHFIPNLLQGIALNPKLMQSDGIHPNVSAQPLITKRVWPILKKILEKSCG